MDWLHHETVEQVRWLTIDRPKTKNAIPTEGWSDLHDAFGAFEKSDDRVLVVRGAGEDFCAGAELADDWIARRESVSAGHQRMKEVARAATRLHRLTKPTIAAVDGVAVGAGMNLALGCDLVVASDRARFSEIFVRRGLTLDFGGSWLLPRIVGLQQAKELALSGRVIDAAEAKEMGLVLEVTSPDQLYRRTAELADSMLKGAPIAQMFAKQGLNAAFESSFEESVSWEGQSQSILFGTEDSAEGVEAFLDRRDPDWKKA